MDFDVWHTSCVVFSVAFVKITVLFEHQHNGHKRLLCFVHLHHFKCHRQTVVHSNVEEMDISEGSLYFFSTMEADMKFKIPDHVKNILSIYGVANALRFATITDSEIDDIEKFVRNDLKEILELNASRICANNELTPFFGIYAACPQKFSFLGFKNTIKLMINYVQDKLKTVSPPSPQADTADERSALEYFCPNQKISRARGKLIKNGTVRTEIGVFYGDKKAMNSRGMRPIREIDHDAAKNNLLNRARELFISFDKDSMEEFNFSLNMIDVEFKGNNAVKPSVTCIYCKYKIKVFFKVSSTGSYAWVLSNLKAHIDNCSKTMKTKKDDDLEDGNDFDISAQCSLDAVHSQENDDDKNEENRNERTIELTIEPSFCEKSDTLVDLENILFTQMKIQIIKMNNMAAKNKEKKRKCSVNVDECQPEKIEICEVKGDGNCLFSVVAHQMYHSRIGSPEHYECTDDLRKEVVEYIKTNLDVFAHEMRGRMPNFKLKRDVDDYDEECNKLLENLAEPGFYGGKESLKAIGLCLKVNIVVFNENGQCYCTNNFNTKYGKAILIIFRGQGANIERNHYDSIVGMKDNLITASTEYLIEKEMQYRRNKNKTDIVNII